MSIGASTRYARALSRCRCGRFALQRSNSFEARAAMMLARHGDEEPSDEQLLARTAAGDQRAFRPLIARHMGRAIRLAQAISGNASDADDIAQDAFLRMWRQAGSFDPDIARFTTWLHRIVVNLAIDRTRRLLSQSDKISSACKAALDKAALDKSALDKSALEKS